jgi:hypothetical protein
LVWAFGEFRVVWGIRARAWPARTWPTERWLLAGAGLLGVSIGSFLHGLSHLISRDLVGKPVHTLGVVALLTLGVVAHLLLVTGLLRWRQAGRHPGSAG